MRASSPSWRGRSMVKCRKGGPGRPPTSDEVGLNDILYGPLRQGMQDASALGNPARLASARARARASRAVTSRAAAMTAPDSKPASRPQGSSNRAKSPIGMLPMASGASSTSRNSGMERGCAKETASGSVIPAWPGARSASASPRPGPSGQRRAESLRGRELVAVHQLVMQAIPSGPGLDCASSGFPFCPDNKRVTWQGGQGARTTRLSCAGRTPPPQDARFSSRPTRPISPNRRGIRSRAPPSPISGPSLCFRRIFRVTRRSVWLEFAPPG